MDTVTAAGFVEKTTLSQLGKKSQLWCCVLLSRARAFLRLLMGWRNWILHVGSQSFGWGGRGAKPGLGPSTVPRMAVSVS